MTIVFLSLAWVQLIPWWLAIAVIARDLIIIAGACCYHALIGPLEFSPTRISKWNTAAQISFCVLMLAVQLLPLGSRAHHRGLHVAGRRADGGQRGRLRGELDSQGAPGVRGAGLRPDR